MMVLEQLQETKCLKKQESGKHGVEENFGKQAGTWETLSQGTNEARAEVGKDNQEILKTMKEEIGYGKQGVKEIWKLGIKESEK